MTRRVEKAGKFVTAGNELVWQETTTFRMSDYGCIYLCWQRGSEGHLVFKLVRSPVAKRYFWSALWNTASQADANDQDATDFASIEDAVRKMLDDGWVVRRARFADLTRSSEEMLADPKE